MALLFLGLALDGKAGDQLEVANDPRGVVQVFAAAFGALAEPVLADVSTGFAQGVGDVEGEIAAAGSDPPFERSRFLKLYCSVRSCTPSAFAI